MPGCSARSAPTCNPPSRAARKLANSLLHSTLQCRRRAGPTPSRTAIPGNLCTSSTLFCTTPLPQPGALLPQPPPPAAAAGATGSGGRCSPGSGRAASCSGTARRVHPVRLRLTHEVVAMGDWLRQRRWRRWLSTSSPCTTHHRRCSCGRLRDTLLLTLQQQPDSGHSTGTRFAG
jgi:hypothetical protein